jgi:peptidoglycan LD-endopeptidase LytH
MRRAGLVAIIALTAFVTFIATSAFWILMYGLVEAPQQPVITEAAEPGERPEPVIGPSGLAIPVLGVRPTQLEDTYTHSRGAGRPHNAIDIMAPAGTPVVSAAPGTVEKLYYSEGGGGISAYVRSEDGRWIYYYAHLREYAPGLAEGQRITRGDPIGTVGSSGNASPEGPHLHFAVYRMEEGERWHQGTPVNPYPLLAGAVGGG